MLIDLRKIEDSEVEFDFQIEPEKVDLEIRFSRLGGKPQFSGTVKNEGWFSVVTGHADVEIERKCDLCYKACNDSVELEIENAYLTLKSFSDEREAQLQLMKLDYSFIENTELDLTAVFTEHLLVGIPDRFRCRDDCKGLCPDCGIDKNTDKCECGERGIDPRWEALSKLKDKI